MGLRKNVQFFPAWHCPECGERTPNGVGFRSESTDPWASEQDDEMISCRCGSSHLDIDGELIPCIANTRIDQIVDYASSTGFGANEIRMWSGYRHATLIHQSTFMEIKVLYAPRRPDDEKTGKINVTMTELISKNHRELASPGDIFKALADPMAAADYLDPHN